MAELRSTKEETGAQGGRGTAQTLQVFQGEAIALLCHSGKALGGESGQVTAKLPFSTDILSFQKPSLRML